MQMLVRGRFDRYIFRPNFLQPTVETWLELCKHLSQEVSLCDTGSGCTNAFNISWKRHAVLGSPGTRLQQSPVGRASDRLVRSQLKRSKRTRLVTQCGHNPEGGSQSSTVDERNLPYDHGAMLRPKPSVVPAGRTRKRVGRPRTLGILAARRQRWRSRPRGGRRNPGHANFGGVTPAFASETVGRRCR